MQESKFREQKIISRLRRMTKWRAKDRRVEREWWCQRKEWKNNKRKRKWFKVTVERRAFCCWEVCKPKGLQRIIHTNLQSIDSSTAFDLILMIVLSVIPMFYGFHDHASGFHPVRSAVEFSYQIFSNFLFWIFCKYFYNFKEKENLWSHLQNIFCWNYILPNISPSRPLIQLERE